ncbi:MAG: polyprenyl synthetase family protein [Methanomicrobiales archaeon]|nr:polyprenyl synthetase family protein [Methanomicrobiales archaeon]MDI6875402.1 polyprenyl synthetase family protein [Methanomicrobiales archaeon]
MDLLEYLEKTAEKVDLALHRHYGSAYGELYKASSHLLLAGGKRLRPAVVLLSADAVNHGRSDDLIPAALALELIHTFTLIHDDIMDGDVERRGVPTVHTCWDEPTAILAGDVLYANAFEFLCRAITDDRSRVKAIAMLARTCALICEGQHMDMSFEKREDVEVGEYLEMVQKKTGALYAAAAAIGGMLAGGTAVQVDALYSYGLSAGIAFQIQDDLIDLMEHSERIGKDRGSDLREGKQTLITIRARERGFDLAQFRKRLSDEEMDRLVHQLQVAGVIGDVRATALERADAAKSALSVLPFSEERKLLTDIVDFFISRGY